ncbi:MAG: N-acetyltransferase [Arcobacteraceae bacterium]
MIRQATLKDCNALYALEQEIFQNDPFALSKASFRYHLKKNSVFKMEINNKLAGYILWLPRKKYFRLYSLAVSKRFQNQGLAKCLLEYSLEHLKEKFFSLEVKVSNLGAIKLYEKFGFKIKKVLKNYYDNEDGYLMEKM